MPYQPTYPYPYMDTIDVERSEGNIFKCLINPKDTVLGATLNIYKNNSESDVVFLSGTGMLSSSRTVRIYCTENQYKELLSRKEDNENLTIRFGSEYRKISSISGSYSNSTFQYMNVVCDERYNLTTNSSYDYTIYTNVTKRVKLPEENFPFYGGVGDASWLQCAVDNTNLYNGIDYKWSLNMSFQSYKSILTGYIAHDGGSQGMLYLLYNENVFNLLKNGISNGNNYTIIINSFEEAVITNVTTTIINGINHMVIWADLSSVYSVGDWFEIYTDIASLTTPEYYFKARSTPEIIFDVPPTISNCIHTFEANYHQKQRVDVAYFEYELYSDGKLVDSSGHIFSQNISYTFENLVNGIDYSIKLIVINNDGIELETTRDFSVSYDLFPSVIEPKISVDNFKGRINVDFSNNATIPASLIGTGNVEYEIFGEPKYNIVADGHLVSYTTSTTLTIQPFKPLRAGMYLKIEEELREIIDIIVDEFDNVTVVLKSEFPLTPDIGTKYEICSYYNGVHLNDKQLILWDNISGSPLILPNQSTQVVHWHASQGFSGIILEKINSMHPTSSVSVYYNGNSFIYKIGSLPEVSFCPYLGTASAIAGKDEYSVVGVVQSYSSSTPSITLENSSLIEVGKSIQIGTEYRTIISVTVGESTSEVVLDHAFANNPIALTDKYVVYDENYIYELSDVDEILDTDILIDSDLAYKYWWLIVILPDEIRFIKTIPFIESEV